MVELAQDVDQDARPVVRGQAHRRPRPRSAPSWVAGQEGHRAGRAVLLLEAELRDGAPPAGLQDRRPVVDDHVAVVDHRDPLGELVGLLQVLRREQDGRPLVDELADHVPQLVAAEQVQAGRGLVQEQHRRPGHERGGDVEAPAHPAGISAERPVGGLVEAEALEQLRRPRRDLRRLHLGEQADQAEVLAAREVGVDRGELTGHPDHPPDRVGLLRDVVAEDARDPGVGLEHGGEDPDRGGLARAVGPQQAEDRTGRDLEVDPVQREHLAEALGEPLDLDRAGHARQDATDG